MLCSEMKEFAKRIQLRSLSISVLFLTASLACAQEPFRSDFGRYRFKLTYLDQSLASLPTVKLGTEILLSGTRYPLFISGEVGYNFYSMDEKTRASGYYLGSRLNLYYNKPLMESRESFMSNLTGVPVGLGVSIGGFYQKSVINGFLSTTRELDGLGEYYQYEKMKYHKERYGLSLEFIRQFPVSDRFYAEANSGLGVVYMNTIVPGIVTQRTFINGLLKGKHVIAPALIISLKIVYLIM
jgi:hypothetical protein